MKLSAEEKRRKRLNELATKIQGAGGPVSLELLVGWAQMRWGVVSVRVGEYLQAIEQAGLVKVDAQKGVVTWLGK